MEQDGIVVAIWRDRAEIVELLPEHGALHGNKSTNGPTPRYSNARQLPSQIPQSMVPARESCLADGNWERMVERARVEGKVRKDFGVERRVRRARVCAELRQATAEIGRRISPFACSAAMAHLVSAGRRCSSDLHARYEPRRAATAPLH